MAVPFLHRADCSLADLGPWEPAQRYWRRNEPEYDVVARSVDGRRLLVGEAKSTQRPLPATALRFAPRAARPERRGPGGRPRGVRARGRTRSRWRKAACTW